MKKTNIIRFAEVQVYLLMISFSQEKKNNNEIENVKI